MKPSPRGPSLDLTSGPILATLVVFAAPTLLGNVLQTLNGTINAIWVGRMLGESALAATANANIIMFLVFSAVFGFGMAATVRIGRAFGAGDIDAARRTFGTAIGFTLMLSTLIALTGWLTAPQLLALLKTPGESAGLALAYLRVIFLSVPAIALVTVASMGLRGSGDATTPLRFMILTIALDIVLNPLLIIGVGPLPALGIAGSALASALASSIGMFALVVWIYAKDLPLRLRGAELRYLIPRRDELAYLTTQGLPMGAQMLVVSGAGVIMIGLVNREGLVVTAAYGATTQLWAYIQMPSLAVAAAVSAMVAQAIGADMHDRVGQITRAGIFANLGMTAVLTALILAFDRPVLALFLGGDSPAIPIARHIQFIATWSFLPLGVMFILFGTLRAYGVVIVPLLVLIFSLYAVRLGFYLFAYPVLGADAIYGSFVVSTVISASLAAIAYRLQVPRQIIRLRREEV